MTKCKSASVLIGPPCPTCQQATSPAAAPGVAPGWWYCTNKDCVLKPSFVFRESRPWAGPKRKNDLLAHISAEDRSQFEPGNVWRHYKGNVYVVTDVVQTEEDGELAVSYRNIDNPTITWVRSLKSWKAPVLGLAQAPHGPVPRFTWLRFLP